MCWEGLDNDENAAASGFCKLLMVSKHLMVPSCLKEPCEMKTNTAGMKQTWLGVNNWCPLGCRSNYYDCERSV